MLPSEERRDKTARRDPIAAFFATPAHWREWLAKHHETERELLVGFYKKGSGRPSITWPESVDAALCFGWIDGIRRSIDAESYSIRFTSRRPRSVWSAVNMKRIVELIESGLVHPAGLKAWEARTAERSGVYSLSSGPRTSSLRKRASFGPIELPGSTSHRKRPVTGEP